VNGPDPLDGGVGGEVEWGGALLGQLSRELSAMETELSALQDAMADLIDRSPPEPDMIRRLQSIDTITQTARNLATVAAAMARSHPAPPGADVIRASVGLKDLAERLARAGSASDAGRPAPRGTGSVSRGEISWF
jgi:hypothetical protein